MTIRFFRTVLLAVFVAAVSPVFAQTPQKPKLSPKETVTQFYALLREGKYRDAFQLSVYWPAIEKLTPEQLRELEPDFIAMSEVIPEKLDLSGENITGRNATVYFHLPNAKPAGEQPAKGDKPTLGVVGKEVTSTVPQTDQIPIQLIQVDGQWKVGDSETRDIVMVLGSRYFFSERQGLIQQMQNNEAGIYDLLNTLATVEVGYAKSSGGIFATLSELLMEKVVKDEVGSGKMFGYKYEIEVSEDRKSFAIYAVPNVHFVTGRFSYFADKDGVRLKNNGGLKLTREEAYKK